MMLAMIGMNKPSDTPTSTGVHPISTFTLYQSITGITNSQSAEGRGCVCVRERAYAVEV